ncbi:MAG: DUF2953 domain-containing protein [Methanolinea sp.]|nr:DUF2953 domain-containing protein [Methanolinea sp.]
MDPAVLLVPALVLVLALCILFVFRIPLRFRVRAEHREDMTLVSAALSWWVIGVRASWSGGPLRLALEAGERAILVREIPIPTARTTPERPGTPGKEESIYPPQLTGMLPYAGQFLHILSCSVSLEKMDLRLTFGLGRAADTGRLFGWYSAVRPLILLSRRVSMEVTPDFSRVVAEGSLDVGFRLDRPMEFGIRMGRLFLQMQDARAGGATG